MNKRDIILQPHLKGQRNQRRQGRPTKGTYAAIQDIVVVDPKIRNNWIDQANVYLCGISTRTGRLLTPSLGLSKDDLDEFCASWLKSRGLIEEV